MTGPHFLCCLRTATESVAHGPDRATKHVTLLFAAVDPMTVDIDGVHPVLTDVGQFGLHFQDALEPLSAQFEPGKLYRLVPA